MGSAPSATRTSEVKNSIPGRWSQIFRGGSTSRATWVTTRKSAESLSFSMDSPDFASTSTVSPGVSHCCSGSDSSGGPSRTARSLAGRSDTPRPRDMSSPPQVTPRSRAPRWPVRTASSRRSPRPWLMDGSWSEAAFLAPRRDWRMARMATWYRSSKSCRTSVHVKFLPMKGLCCETTSSANSFSRPGMSSRSTLQIRRDPAASCSRRSSASLLAACSPAPAEARLSSSRATWSDSVRARHFSCGRLSTSTSPASTVSSSGTGKISRQLGCPGGSRSSSPRPWAAASPRGPGAQSDAARGRPSAMPHRRRVRSSSAPWKDTFRNAAPPLSGSPAGEVRRGPPSGSLLSFRRGGWRKIFSTASRGTRSCSIASLRSVPTRGQCGSTWTCVTMSSFFSFSVLKSPPPSGSMRTPTRTR
mmetsp:Transcript_101543/g.268245  ORF Transcript_101543/g.268245 Transcript_101543/m.268245 type:complete len:416 (+) Transcript_101543:605-1852(+)